MSPRRESYSTDRIGSYDGSNFFRLSTMTGSPMRAGEVAEHYEMNEIAEYAPAARVIARLKEALDG